MNFLALKLLLLYIKDLLLCFLVFLPLTEYLNKYSVLLVLLQVHEKKAPEVIDVHEFTHLYNLKVLVYVPLNKS